MIMRQRPRVKCFQEIIFSVIELDHNYWEVEFSAKESLDFLLSPLLSGTTCRLLRVKPGIHYSFLSSQRFSLMSYLEFSKILSLSTLVYCKHELLILLIQPTQSLSFLNKYKIFWLCLTCVSVQEVEENFFLIFSIAWTRASCTFPELWIQFLFFQFVSLVGKLQLALSIFRKPIGRLWYLQVKFSPKSKYNLLDLLFMSEVMISD